jgi:hypothetical protein
MSAAFLPDRTEPFVKGSPMLSPPAFERRAVMVAVALALFGAAGAARAQVAPMAEPMPAPPSPEAPSPDALSPERTVDPWANVRRPWLYAADPTAPPAGHAIASLGVGYARVDRGASRPFASDIAHAGAVFSAGAEVGLLRIVSLRAEGLLAGQDSAMSAGAMVGATLYPLDPKGPVNLACSGGYLREIGGDNGIWARVAVASDLGAARFVFTALGEHVFAASRSGEPERRDSIDLVLTAGAVYSLTQAVRLGAEYVVQDLEGAWDREEVDGGIRHFVGPVASFDLGRRVALAAGPAFGLSKGSPTLLGRLAATFAF